MRLLNLLFCVIPLTLGCQARAPIETLASVDLNRFMGDWFVIAAIPTALEKDAYNAKESYRLLADGTVDTVFTFRDGSFDGPARRYNPTGFVEDRSGAVWGMQFIWPFRAEYRISYLDPEYQRAIIARTARDYVWIMARKPQVSDSAYRELTDKVRTLGYNVTSLRRVPQRWDQ